MSPSLAGIVPKATPLALTRSARKATISVGEGRRRDIAVLSSVVPTLSPPAVHAKPRPYHAALLRRPLHPLAALDLVGLVDRGGVLLAGAAVDGLLLAVPGVDRVVAA